MTTAPKRARRTQEQRQRLLVASYSQARPTSAGRLCWMPVRETLTHQRVEVFADRVGVQPRDGDQRGEGRRLRLRPADLQRRRPRPGQRCASASRAGTGTVPGVIRDGIESRLFSPDHSVVKSHRTCRSTHRRRSQHVRTRHRLERGRRSRRRGGQAAPRRPGRRPQPPPRQSKGTRTSRSVLRCRRLAGSLSRHARTYVGRSAHLCAHMDVGAGGPPI